MTIQEQTLEVHTLDVWGNEDDGFEVNASYRSGVTMLTGQDYEYYYEQVREFFWHLPPFEIKWQDDHLAHVDCWKTGKPLLTIQLV